MRIKALSVVAPSGQRIACGEKTLEIRRWKPSILPNEDLLVVENDIFLTQDGMTDPKGRAVAVVRVLAVRPYLESDQRAACASSHEPGWWAWVLSKPHVILPHRPILAARGIYTVTLPELDPFA